MFNAHASAAIESINSQCVFSASAVMFFKNLSEYAVYLFLTFLSWSCAWISNLLYWWFQCLLIFKFVFAKTRSMMHGFPIVSRFFTQPAWRLSYTLQVNKILCDSKINLIKTPKNMLNANSFFFVLTVVNLFIFFHNCRMWAINHASNELVKTLITEVYYAIKQLCSHILIKILPRVR